MSKSIFIFLHGFSLYLLLIIIPGAGYAQEEYQPVKDTDAFRQQMLETSQNTHSISSDFVQLKHLSFLEEDIESTGIFYFKKENQLRWEYTRPFFYLIIFSHDTIMIQDDQKTSHYDAASGRIFREINNIMLSMVNGSILESEEFTFEYFENADSYKLELSPQDPNMKAFLTKIRLFINKDDYAVDELFMIEKSDDYTHIRFINKRLNEDIPQHIFDLH
ncbi:MAG: outer membrane lipoprotein carrier protein LolA [Bacteroidota bacterium]